MNEILETIWGIADTVFMFGLIIFMIMGFIKSFNSFYDFKNLEKKLKRFDLKSRDFLIISILSLAVISSFFVKEDLRAEIFTPSFMLFIGCFLNLKMFQKIQFHLLDEREGILFLKSLAFGGIVFVYELLGLSFRPDLLIKTIGEKGGWWFFVFMYLFNVSIIAFFIFRKNEKSINQSTEHNHE